MSIRVNGQVIASSSGPLEKELLATDEDFAIGTTSDKAPTVKQVKEAFLTADALDSKADLDLNNTNVFTTSDGIVSLKTSTPEKAEAKEVVSADWVNNKLTSTVTNCITEIPQDIKVGIFTEGDLKRIKLLAGSKIWFPQGFKSDGVTKKFNYQILDEDVVFDNAFWSVNDLLESAVILFGEGTSVTGTTGCRVGANITSGDTAPTAFTENRALWYDTKENYVKYTSDSGATWVHASFPVFEGRPVTSKGWVDGVEHIFNGFGYIGSCHFLLPGVKCLATFGRDDSGNIINKRFEVDSVKVSANLPPAAGGGFWSGFDIRVDGTMGYMGSYTHRSITSKTKPNVTNVIWYNPETAESHYINHNGVVSTALIVSIKYALLTAYAGKITGWSVINEPFEAVNHWDGGFLSAQSMPSSKYINLTLGASGSTYTAPANGWFYIKKEVTPDAKQYCALMVSNDVFQAVTAPTGGNSCCTIVPILKGQTITVVYNATGTTTFFRFIYADGEV